jgi:tetratricopeptide (TPR) repeat protein
MLLPGQPRDTREKLSARQQSWVLFTLVAAGLVVSMYLGSVPLLVLGGTVLVMWVFHYVLMTRVLMPTGATTPGDKPLSHIEAMVARGDYAKAADAYRREVATDAGDFLSCERLAMLARTHLKDPELALSMYREAERRTTAPRRKCGYAVQALGVLRDDLKDAGRAVVEIRRILATYPDVPNTTALQADLNHLRNEHFKHA